MLDVLKSLFGIPDLDPGETGLTGRDWRTTRRTTGKRRPATSSGPASAGTAKTSPKTGGTADTKTVATTTRKTGDGTAHSRRKPAGTKSGGARTSAKDSKTAKGAAAGSSSPRGKTGRTADELTRIKGLGPAAASALEAAGVTTLAQLAAADPDQLAQRIDAASVTRGRLDTWIRAARRQA